MADGRSQTLSPNLSSSRFLILFVSNLRSEEEPRLFGDVPSYNITNIYQSVLSADGIMQLQIQNFFNFFTSTMFWLSYIPLYDRLYPIFNENNYQDAFQKFGFSDVPNFNVTTIYEETYLSDTVAIQLLQVSFCGH